MGRPSRTRDVMGAVLLVVVGLLYMSGVSDVRDSWRADGDGIGTSHPGVMAVAVEVAES